MGGLSSLLPPLPPLGGGGVSFLKENRVLSVSAATNPTIIPQTILVITHQTTTPAITPSVMPTAALILLLVFIWAIIVVFSPSMAQTVPFF